MTVIHDPDNYLERIDHIWAFISSDENGEGVCAAPFSKFGPVPLIAADEARLKSLMPIARELARMTDKKIKLVKFTVREEITEIGA